MLGANGSLPLARHIRNLAAWGGQALGALGEPMGQGRRGARVGGPGAHGRRRLVRPRLLRLDGLRMRSLERHGRPQGQVGWSWPCELLGLNWGSRGPVG